jgi:hypothetical protein
MSVTLVSLIVVHMVAGESPPGLAQLLGDLAIEMQNQTGSEDTLRAIVDGAVSLVPGTRWPASR